MLPVEEKLKTNLQIAVVILFFVALITLPYISDKHKQNAKFHTEFPFDER
jgi:preprotein translocase subunit SecG